MKLRGFLQSATLGKKRENRSNKSNVPGVFLDNVATDIDFTDEPVVQWGYFQKMLPLILIL